MWQVAAVWNQARLTCDAAPHAQEVQAAPEGEALLGGRGNNPEYAARALDRASASLASEVGQVRQSGRHPCKHWWAMAVLPLGRPLHARAELTPQGPGVPPQVSVLMRHEFMEAATALLHSHLRCLASPPPRHTHLARSQGTVLSPPWQPEL